MTTSGITALALTASDVIEFALREINAIPIGQDVDIGLTLLMQQQIGAMNGGSLPLIDVVQ